MPKERWGLAASPAADGLSEIIRRRQSNERERAAAVAVTGLEAAREARD